MFTWCILCLNRQLQIAFPSAKLPLGHSDAWCEAVRFRAPHARCPKVSGQKWSKPQLDVAQVWDLELDMFFLADGFDVFNLFQPALIGVTIPCLKSTWTASNHQRLVLSTFRCGNYNSPTKVENVLFSCRCPRPHNVDRQGLNLNDLVLKSIDFSFEKQKRCGSQKKAPWPPFSWDRPTSWSLQSPGCCKKPWPKATKYESCAPSTRFGWHACGPGDETWPQTSRISTNWVSSCQFWHQKNHPIRVSPKNSSSSHMSLRRPRADAILLPLTAQTWRFDLNIWCFPTEIDPCLGAVRHKWAQHPFHGECLWLLLELFFWWLKPVPSVKLLGRITTPASLIASGTSNGAGGPASSSSRTSGVSAVLGGWA